MTEDRIVREPEATLISGLGKSRRHELAKQGKFPNKVKISERASGYRLSELMRWLESRPPIPEGSPIPKGPSESA